MAAPSINLLPLAVALFLLGLGWNFAYVAGSTLLADQLSPGERAKTQGFNDLLLNLSSGTSQIASGVVFAVGGYGIMALAAAAAGGCRWAWPYGGRYGGGWRHASSHTGQHRNKKIPVYKLLG
jgi:MFS family permease